MPRKSSKRLTPVAQFTYEPYRRNPIKLGEDSFIDEHMKQIRVGDKPSILGLSEDELRIDGNLFLNGKLSSHTIECDSDYLEFRPNIYTRFESSDFTGNLDLYVTSGDSYFLTSGTHFNFLSEAVGTFKIGSLASSTDIFIFDIQNTKLTIKDDADTGDRFDLVVAEHGATTISTTDDDATAGHLTLDIDGSLIFDPADGKYIAKNNGTEFSATDSAYAGMVLGYTRLQGDGSTQNLFEIQNAITVEDAEHKITFKTPPSENVEIQCTFLINALSSDTRVSIGLSDNSTYNSIGIMFEYDSTGISFTDDEVDDGVRTVVFVLGASELASVGSSNTFYVGFGTSGITKTAYLSYGARGTHGICDHPFVIKATALPVTIHDGE